MTSVKDWSPVQPYTPDVVKICTDAKPQIEKKTGKKFHVYCPLLFSIETEIKHHYKVKVDVGGRECFHAVIFAPGGGANVNVEEVIYPIDVYVPLI